MTKAFTPDSLADRWEVSPTTVRNMCEQGRLSHFRLGKLYRIPADAVEEIETCQTSQSEDLGGDTASHGEKVESVNGFNLRHAPERKRKPRPVTNS